MFPRNAEEKTEIHFRSNTLPSVSLAPFEIIKYKNRYAMRTFRNLYFSIEDALQNTRSRLRKKQYWVSQHMQNCVKYFILDN
jgi:hypothetical protein